MLTLHDVTERLKKVDEISLLEILDIYSEELVDRFGDLIQERYPYLAEELSDDCDDYQYELDLEDSDNDY